LIAVAQTDLALRNQPIRVLVAVDVLVARSRSALQVEFIGAAANLFLEIDREIDHNEVGRLAILRNFGRNLHSGRLNRGCGFLAATGGRACGCLASHAVLLTDTQFQEWSYVTNKRHSRTPISRYSTICEERSVSLYRECLWNCAARHRKIRSAV